MELLDAKVVDLRVQKVGAITTIQRQKQRYRQGELYARKKKKRNVQELNSQIKEISSKPPKKL